MMNQEERAAYFRDYRRKHRTRLIKYSRKYRRRNREAINAARRKKYHTDEAFRQYEIERHAAKRRTGETHEND